MSLRDKLKAVIDRKPVKEPVPEWSLDLFLKPISAADRERYFDMCMDRSEGEKFKQTGLREWVLSRTLCDEDGTLLYNDTTVAEFMDHDPNVVERVWERSMDLSALSVKSVERLEKNSKRNQPSGSSSASV